MLDFIFDGDIPDHVREAALQSAEFNSWLDTKAHTMALVIEVMANHFLERVAENRRLVDMLSRGEIRTDELKGFKSQ